MKRNRFFRELIDAVGGTSSDKALKRALSRLRASYDYDYFAFLNLHAHKVHAVSDYPEEWKAIYLAGSYTTVDPIITSAKRINRPFEWSIERERRRAEDDVKRFCDEAASFGIRSGLSIPMRTGQGRYALLTLASSRDADRGVGYRRGGFSGGSASREIRPGTCGITETCHLEHKRSCISKNGS